MSPNTLPSIWLGQVVEPQPKPPHPEVINTAMLKTWLTCPLQYKLINIDGVQWDYIPSAFLLEHLIGAGVSRYYSELKAGVVIEAAKLLEAWDELWEGSLGNIKLEPGVHTDDIRHLGSVLLETFANQERKGRVLECGNIFRAPLVNMETGVCMTELQERIGMVEADDKGFLTVVNTSVKPDISDDDDPYTDLKLLAYSYLVRSAWDLQEGPIPLRNDQLVYQPVPQVYSQPFITQVRDEARYTLLAEEMLTSIDAQVFAAKPGISCATCPVRSSCSAN